MNKIAMRLASKIFDQPLIGNQYRSAFIEAMIEPCLALHGWRYVGDGWRGWDFERTDGARLEVKQSAARQTWSVSRNLATRGASTLLPGRAISTRVGGFPYRDDTPKHMYLLGTLFAERRQIIAIQVNGSFISSQPLLYPRAKERSCYPKLKSSRLRSSSSNSRTQCNE